MIKSGSVNHKPNPPAVDGGPVKKFKKANQKQKKTVDVREGLTGPAANASGPFPPGQRPLQCHKCKGWGHVRRGLPFVFKLYKGGNAKQNLPPPRTGVCRGTGSTCKEDPIVAKAVKMADRYHNPDPLI